MTNTDQIGFWQAPPRAQAAQRQEAEVLPDAGDGGDAGGDDGAEERNEMGLTAAEQADFDAMRTGDTPAGDEPGDDPADDSLDPDDAHDDDATVQDPPEPQQRQPGERQQAEPPAQQKNPKTVNYSKYQRELKRANDARAASEQALQKEREDRIKLATRVEMINEALQQRPPAQQEEQEAPVSPFEEPDIDPDEDFKGAVAQVNRRVKFQQEQQQQTHEAFQETHQDQQMKDTFTRDFQAYAARDPSINQAYQHLKDARLTQICIAEFDKDPNDPNEQFTPQEVQRMVKMFNDEEKWLVGKAISEKRSPAAAIMRMAKTFGFKPQAAQEQQAAPAARQQQAPAAQVPAKRPAAPAARNGQQEPDALTQLRELQRNQDDARSLSDGGGAPPPTGLSAEMILRLNDDEFGELLDTMPDWQLNQILGRLPGGAG